MAKIRALRKCSLFRTLTYRDLAILAPYVREELAEPNTMIAQEGSPTHGLVLIKKGKVHVRRETNPSAFIELTPGEFFGELSLGDSDQTRGITAQAMDSCEFLRIDPADYRRLFEASPEVAGKVAQGVLTAVSDKVVGLRELLSNVSSNGSDQH